ncbi:PadR family transcriptional regulator [Rhizorhabdus dicambivorans]|uniref:PadR family transcriptional regulator n=1 Tax=Rhizorhabdus dicambivorans TaxID=1850238 RepID=A0A2A4FPI9_9SPHN|nr:PadR family transcriptional regulator [Rhizorhabdus dicambivorans]ATE63830.1 PadR family transcriptional regulator [Rhizorhabdus dicambivorans]PCE40665.1 PadR family transcriptional regulator [Rhizorhabdus dicambivorans]
MALTHAILTALSHEPLSGYDLAKEFRTSTGYFWRATRQQIYTELRRLETQDMIAGMRREQDKLPDKIIWSITPLGIEALQAWLDSPSPPASIKEELLVKMYALEYADLPKLRAQLADRRAYHLERRALFGAIEARIAKNEQIDRSNLGRLLGARCGVLYEQAMITWCDEAVAQLE